MAQGLLCPVTSAAARCLRKRQSCFRSAQVRYLSHRQTTGRFSMNPADTAFIILCATFVMLMTPALALFYGGLVRSKNILSTCMHSYASLGMVSIPAMQRYNAMITL